MTTSKLATKWAQETQVWEECMQTSTYRASNFQISKVTSSIREHSMARLFAIMNRRCLCLTIQGAATVTCWLSSRCSSSICLAKDTWTIRRTLETSVLSEETIPCKIIIWVTLSTSNNSNKHNSISIFSHREVVGITTSTSTHFRTWMTINGRIQTMQGSVETSKMATMTSMLQISLHHNLVDKDIISLCSSNNLYRILG